LVSAFPHRWPPEPALSFYPKSQKNMKNLFLLLCCLPLGLWAQYTKVADSQAFENKLRTATQNTQTLMSDFVQTKHIDVLSEDIVSTGRFVYKKDNLLRWEYQEPFVYLLVINRGKLTVKDERSKNAFDLSNNKTFNKINDLITKSLQGDAMLHNPDYRHELLEDSKEFLLKLYPEDKKTREFMQQIDIFFNKSDYQVKRIDMRETSGDYTRIVFKNRKINEPVSDKLFMVD